jgi:hypothetical protein
MNHIGTLLCLVLCIGFGMEALRRLRIDRATRIAGADEYHLMHGPNDGCVECEGK